MDTYQAVYDAVRSKISRCDISEVIDSAIRNMGIGDEISNVAYEYKLAANATKDYSVILRPKLYIDGDKWCALYGENIQDGVCGFGSSPAEALQDFELSMFKKINDE